MTSSQLFAAVEAAFRDKADKPFSHVMMMMPPGLPPRRFVEYARLFAEQVIPVFA